MAFHAARLLAHGWWRGRKRWWIGATAVLIVVQFILLSVAALFIGMEAETEERIAAFYTGDGRITPGSGGAAPTQYWIGDDLTDATSTMSRHATGVEAHLESQFILSRRGLLEAYLQEDDQYGVQAPGATTDGSESYGIGILIGTDDARNVAPYLVAGRIPDAGADDVELLMSESQYRVYAGDELAGFNAPPSAAELASVRFEITTARIDPNSDLRDVIRERARVVGLFATELDAVDTFTLVTTRNNVAALLGFDDPNMANVLILENPTSGAQSAADARGWTYESAGDFAQRYIGQLVGVVRMLSILLSALFVALPSFLIWSGVSQLLEHHRREYAVCRAVGISARDLSGGAAILVGRLIGISIIGTMVLAFVGKYVVARFVSGSDLLPMPVRYALDPAALLGTFGLVVLAVGVAVWGTMRRHVQGDLASAMRSP